jgi:DHA3 family macrolide efflux protein-like MFS transporter
LGIVIPFFNISSKTIIQNKVPQAKLGVIFNSYFALMNLSQPIGLLGIPVLIGVFGVTSVLLVGGAFYLIAAIMLVLFNQISVELNE